MALKALADAPPDFDFVIGDWNVKHKRLKDRLVGCTEWIEFDGEMSTQKIMGGFGNVEDNRLQLPTGEYRAVALRSFDAATRRWSIWWLDGRNPDQMDVPVVGQFKEGVGTFYADDVLNGQLIKIRFVWLPVSSSEAQWNQAFSTDAGVTWEINWTMAFTRR